MTEPHDEIDRRVRALLPDVRLPPALAARVHAQARAAFDGAGGARRAAGLATAAAVVSACALYLAWAVEFLTSLARS